jgi:hypothetical protein
MIAHRVRSDSHRTLGLESCPRFEVGEFRLHEVHLTFERVACGVESLVSVSLRNLEQMFRFPGEIAQAIRHALAACSFRGEDGIRSHGCGSFNARAFE